MLASEMIRKMARGYSDQQVWKQSNRLLSGTGWWANGFNDFYERVVFFEETPEGLADPDDVVTDTRDLEIWAWAQATGPQVWPVMLRPLGEGYVEVMFTDGQDLKIWANARYVSAILKRDPHVDWHFTPADGGMLKASNGEVVALLMPLIKDDVDRVTLEYSEWSISNFDLVAPRYLAIARQIDDLLPRGKKGQDWQEVAINGQTVQAMRRTTPGLRWTEGRIISRTKKYYENVQVYDKAKMQCTKSTKKKVEICIRQNGQQAEIDLYDGHTKLGISE